MRSRSLFLSLLLFLSCAPMPAQSAGRALIEGDIIDASTNRPIAGARVKIETPQDPIYAKGDDEGHFVFRDLAPGFYQLIVDVPGFHLSRATVDVRTPSPSGDPAGTNPPSRMPSPAISKSLDADGTVHAKVTAPMTAYSAIAGRVTDPYGEPLAGAEIEILRPLPAMRGAASPPANTAIRQTMVQADGQGEYRAGKLEPGTYWVLANKGGYPAGWTWESSYRITYYPAALDLGSARAITVGAGQQFRADIQILRKTGVSVSGHLLGLPAQPGLYTQITLRPVKSATMNPDAPYTFGSTDYQLTDVMPGRYTLIAQTTDPQSEPLNANRKSLFGLIRDVEIGSQDMAGFDLVLEPVKSLTGKVQFTAPCKDIAEHIRLRGEAPTRATPEAAIGADGSFVIRDVPAGRYRISVSGGDAQRYSQLPVASAVKGGRDVLHDGLQAPWPDDGVLAIKLTCGNQGVRE